MNLPILCLSIVLICSSKTIESFSNQILSGKDTWVGSFAFELILLVMAATITRLPSAFEEAEKSTGGVRPARLASGGSLHGHQR